jgi:hypothetical protein
MADFPVPFNNRDVSYTAAGSETDFATDYPIWDETDVTVIRTRSAVTTTLTLTTDYTVSIAAATGIATITPVGSIVAADTWRLKGNMTIDRTSDYAQRSSWPASQINEDFDRQIAMLQELARDLAAATVAPQTLPLSTVNGGTGASYSTQNLLWKGLAATKPTFLAHKNGSNQTSITSATDTKITFGTEAWDVGGYYANGTSIWTPPAGKYRVTVGVRMANTNAVDNELINLLLYKNGASHRTAQNRRGSTNTIAVLLTVLVEANGTDTFEVYVNKSGAGDGEVAGTVTDTWWCADTIA